MIQIVSQFPTVPQVEMGETVPIVERIIPPSVRTACVGIPVGVAVAIPPFKKEISFIVV
jgi:hypothetical protein